MRTTPDQLRAMKQRGERIPMLTAYDYSMASILEVRANTGICVNQCKTHECFKGGRVDGCPMFRHALFLEENHSCRVCTYCVKNCPYRSVQINLRPPGEELWNVQKPLAGGAFFAILLATLVFAVVLPDLPGFEFSMRRILPFLPDFPSASFTVLMILLVAAALGVFWAGELLFDRSEKGARFARYSLGFIPLALCGHFANQLENLPGAGRLSIQITEQASASVAVFATFHIIWPFQLILVIVGTLWSIFVLFRDSIRDREEGLPRKPRLILYLLGLLVFYGAAFIWMFVAVGKTI